MLERVVVGRIRWLCLYIYYNITGERFVLSINIKSFGYSDLFHTFVVDKLI
jgi:hypothetical protein